MKHVYLFIALLSSHLWSASIVVVQGAHSDFGRKYFAGFSSLVREHIMAFQYEGEKELALIRKIREIHPDLVFVIGDVPIDRLSQSLPATPFILGDYYGSSLANKANVILMEANQPIEPTLDLGLKLLGTKKKIGTIYDPKHSQNVFDQLSNYAKTKGTSFSAIKVDRPQDVASFINAFEGKIEVFLAIRDNTLSHPISTQAIEQFGLRTKTPILSLEPSLNGAGAVMTVSIDPIELGAQAFNIAKIILVEKKIPLMNAGHEPSVINVAVSIEKALQHGLSLERVINFLRICAQEGYQVSVTP